MPSQDYLKTEARQNEDNKNAILFIEGPPGTFRADKCTPQMDKGVV